MHTKFLLAMRGLPRRLCIGTTQAMQQLSNGYSSYIPGQDVPLRAVANACHGDTLSTSDSNRSERTDPSKFRFASGRYKVEPRIVGTIAQSENLEHLLHKSSWSSLKVWDDSKTEPDLLPLVTGRCVRQAHLQSKVGNGSLTSLTGHGIFTVHKNKNPFLFGYQSFSTESSDSTSPPQYWQCGSTLMRRPSLELPPSEVPSSRAQEPSGIFVDHCPYALLDDEFINESSFVLHYSLDDYYTKNPVMECISILGEPVDNTFWKICESTKYSFHDFISKVMAFHDLGVCFSDISEATVAVDSSGKYSFIKGKFFFVACTVEGVENDFRNISKLFSRIIVISVGEEVARFIPNDFRLLQNLMDTDGCTMRYLIITHSSLLPMESKGPVYMNMYQTLNGKLTFQEIKDLLEPIPSGIGWFLSATRNNFLSDCLRRHESMMRRNNPNFYFLGTKRELFDTGRHLYAHRYEIWKSMFFYYPMRARDVDLMWDILFGDFTSHIQYRLCKKGDPCMSILKLMRIEDQFLDRKITRPW